MNGLYYLAHLVQTKNDLNRRRRRFYAIANGLMHRAWRGRSCPDSSGVHYKPHKSFPRKYAQAMYKQTKEEMKAMTAHMRATRTEIKAEFEWTNHGAIHSIKLDNKRYLAKEIARLAECYLADKILLGE